MEIVMQTKQEQEWKIAQDINLSIDLITATKQHLQFLAIVDHNRWISENGPTLQRAIYRYNECWIPLLAKHSECPLFEGPLVVPLDCEWIWHCHRLNPITYITDCQAMYAKILDNENVLSSTQESSVKQTKLVWEMLYPNEPFVLNMNDVSNENNNEEVTKVGKFTKYDLESAAQRQSLFYSQVSGSCMINDLYLEGALAKYKGFLHLIKRDMELGIDNFLAPTYEIDLIWHTHQLNPISYYNDLVSLLGMVMGHDDTVTDRTEGQKLDAGFTTTLNTWSHMYGYRYPIITQDKASLCGKPVECKSSNFSVAETVTSPCGKPGEIMVSPCEKPDETIASPCGKPMESNTSPCGKPCESMVSPCGKPMESNISPCGKLGESMASPWGNLLESKVSPCGKPGEFTSSPCGKPMASKVSPCGKPCESTITPCGKPMTSNVISCGKPGESMVSPCGKPMESKASPCGNPMESKASPCGKLVESKVSPCGKPSEYMGSPCGKTIESKVSPCGKPMVSKVSPCGKPGESTTSPCGKPMMSNVSPCGKPSESMASPCGKPMESKN